MPHISNIFIYILLTLILSSCSFQEQDRVSETSQSGWIYEETTGISETWEEITDQEIVQNKIETIRKRLALKGLIIDGDTYYRDWQLPLALKKYQDFYKQNSEDDLIKKKIADTYFEMKKFESALSYYKQLSTIDGESTHQMNLSLWYSTDLRDPIQRKRLLWTLEETHSKWDILFYNTNSLSCVSDFHSCKVDFDIYFTPQEDESEEPYEIIWEEIPQKKWTLITHPELLNIREAIENYRNFQLDDVTLKNAYIIWAYFEDKMYNLAAILGEELLLERPWYKPVLKIVAQSYFELGDYKNARSTLSKYYEIDDNDPAVAYMLWVVHTKLKDFVLSNIYFSKALSLSYTPSTNVYRQLVHNYYTLENESKIRSTFKDMIKFEENYEVSDLSLAIYYHILWKDYITALKWAKLWQEKFPETTDFYGYEWWIYREQWNISLAENILESWLKLDSNNPFVIINLAYTKIADDKLWAALIYFKKVIKDFPKTEFAVMAQNEVDSLSQK